MEQCPLSAGSTPSQEVEWAMEQYIKEALQQGYVRPLTSPASAGVFFVKKRDGGLRPCVDYRGLNKLLVQYLYLLPLVPATLEQMRGARHFTKLDLRSAYNLIQIKEGDKWKTAFSTSTGHYEYLVLSYGLASAPSVLQAYINEVLREFLGKSVVAYIDDILIYSPSRNQHVHDVWAVLQTLLGNHPYCKVEKCEFHCKEIPSCNNRTLRVGAVLSQHTGERGGLRPITYFSRKLSSAERNYGVENCEFLVMKLAFEEWRHWLEGARHPFTVYTNHKNLEYIQTIKRINARQATWSIFFFRLQFKVTYSAGERNTRVDALSHPNWTERSRIKEANPYPQCPDNRLYVSPAHHGALITWAHTFLGTGHPGAACTTQLIGWPAMPKEVVRYVASCPHCACSKMPQVPPAGKLLPLPTPHQPWSHLAVDFVIDLPVSEGLLPKDIVSDQGPQFTSRVWKELLGKLNIMVSLTSGYHPQANEQVERVNWPEADRWCQESEWTWEETHQNLCRAIPGYKRKADKKRGETPKYEIRQKVWASTRDGRAGATGKLKARYEGPYSTTGRVNEVTYRVGLTGSSQASRAFHVSSLKPVREGPFTEEGDSPEIPPLPLVMAEDPVYRVHSLLNSRRRGWGLQYLVDWKGYGPEEHCWVPASQVLDPDLIASFHR
ncbi:hypothetical protein P4O66_015612, partial [Electrophorus voltai]